MALSPKYPVLILLVVMSFGVYLNALPNDFVYDDKTEIFENPWIKGAGFIPEIFLSHSWAYKGTASTSNHYHPMKFVVHMAQYRLFGTKPMGYHLTNVIVHAMVTLIVFFIAGSLFQQFLDEKTIVFPASAALLFAVHPIHTEPVAWVSGMSELFMSFFCLVSFLLYINASEQEYRKIIISSLSFLIAALFKATAIAFLPLYFVYDYSLGKGFFAEEVKDRSAGMSAFRRYLPFIIAALAYLSLRTYAIEGFIPEKGRPDFTPWQIVINVFPLVRTYIEMLLLPVHLNIFHVFHPVFSLSDSRTLIALAVNALFVAAVFAAKRKTNGLFLTLLWIIVPLFPVLYFPAFTGESVLAERYLYLPSAGFAIAAALFSRGMYSRKVFKGMTVPIFAAGFAIVILLGTLQTAKRNHIWRNDFSLWTDTAKKSSDSFIVQNNLGIALEQKGRLEEAIISFQAGLKINPNHAKTHNNLGNAYYRKGLLDDAVREYRVALSLDPAYRDALYNLSVVSAMRDAVTSSRK